MNKLCAVLFRSAHDDSGDPFNFELSTKSDKKSKSGSKKKVKSMKEAASAVMQKPARTTAEERMRAIMGM